MIPCALVGLAGCGTSEPPRDRIAAVITYARNSWGNDYSVCFPEQVKAAR
ncbi:MAG: hypothetical protein JRJ84_03995 [Deltaproteobacteria bacterium]|nr:hypothetical protein [Deltaproteobacteria bacterium]